MREREISLLTCQRSVQHRWAIHYISRGWPVLPLHSPVKEGVCSCGRVGCSSVGKHPRTKNGSKDVSLNNSVVQEWWSMWPEANIGIATGSLSQLIVVDVDPRHGGGKSWENWVAKNDIPSTLKVSTGGGGYHLYFSTTAIIKNKVGVLPGVDIRGEGGYIIAPGSFHASMKPYTWTNDLVTTAIAALPKTLEDLIKQDSKDVQDPPKNIIPLGSRHTTFVSLAGLLRRHGLESKGITEALKAINQTLCSSPLEIKEISSIAQSVSKYDTDLVIAWQEPNKLAEFQTAVPSLSETLLPDSIEVWALDIAERMQVPLEFIAAPLVVSLSSVIGRQIGIYPKQKDDWFVIPNLWGAVIARPGFFKSPAISEAMRPLDALISKARVEFDSEKIVCRAKEEVLNAKIDGLKDAIKKATRKGNEHELPSLQKDLEAVLTELQNIAAFETRYKTNDATIEKLGCLLKENPNGLLVVRDELSGWLSSLKKSGHEGDREFYLESWNGYGSYTVDRIGRGTLHVPALCLSVFGGLQPGKLEAYVNQIQDGIGFDDCFKDFKF